MTCSPLSSLQQDKSDYRIGDSCINQILSIAYDIFHCLDKGMEPWAIFLDTSKTFDKVWYKGIIYKSCHFGFTGNLLTLLTDFLSNRKQKVVKANWLKINGQHSFRAGIRSGVPEGSILGPLLFLIYINNLMENFLQNFLPTILLYFWL